MKNILFILFAANSLFAQNEQNGYYYINEFITGVNATSSNFDGTTLYALNSGTGAGVSAGTASAANVVGQIRLTTGTTATGRTCISSVVTSVRLGGGEWNYRIKLPAISTLSDGTQRYQLLCGFFDTQTSPNQVDGVYFLYDDGGVSTNSTASANWQTATVSNSSRTITATSTAVSASGHTLDIYINADGTSVDFYVDGVSVRTETATIPIGAGRELGFGVLLIKSIGTTARTVDIDYVKVLCNYTVTK